MTDTNAVRIIIKEMGLKYSFIADKIGITPYSLQLKLDNKREFTVTQVAKLCGLLRISSLKRRQELFFKEKVD